MLYSSGQQPLRNSGPEQHIQGRPASFGDISVLREGGVKGDFSAAVQKPDS